MQKTAKSLFFRIICVPFPPAKNVKSNNFVSNLKEEAQLTTSQRGLFLVGMRRREPIFHKLFLVVPNIVVCPLFIGILFTCKSKSKTR